QGHTVFLEMSPHPVLTMALNDTFDAAGSDAVALGTLQRDRDEATQFLTALAHAHTKGVEVDWAAFFAGQRPRRVDLPTYAFDNEHYWLRIPAAAAGDAASIGLSVVAHPMVAAGVPLADGVGYLFCGCLLAQTHPRVDDHPGLGQIL